MVEALSREQALAHPNVHVLDHPLLLTMLDHMRDQDAPPRRVRRLVQKISRFVLWEATRAVKLEPVRETKSATGDPLTLHDIVGRVAVVPILRSGFGMLQAAHEILPNAPAWCLGLERDEETLQAREYYPLPKVIPSDFQLVIALDPMLATGGSGDDAICAIKKRGAKQVVFAGLIGAPEGVARLVEHHPDVPIFLAALDRELDERGFIRQPGAGDVGDRQMGTL